MIRLVTFLRRHPRLGASDFQDLLLSELGPLVAAHQAPLGIARYTLTLCLPELPPRPNDELRGQMEDPYDAVAEFWFASLEAFAEACANDAGKRASVALLDVESDLVDLPVSPLWFAHEYPQFSNSAERYVARPNSPLVKAYFPIRQLPEWTFSDAQHHWHTNHGSLVRGAAPSLDMLQYQQAHRFQTPLEDELRELRGVTVDAYLGHAETWQNRSISRPAGSDYERIRQLVIEDEMRFIDYSRSTLVIGKEHVFVDRF